MITRQWVLKILSQLPVYWWPVFLVELYALKTWLETGPVAPGEMLVFGVTPQGRIMLDGYYPAARGSAASLTAHAACAPWSRLETGASAAPSLAAARGDSQNTAQTPPEHRRCTRHTLLRPFAPS
ncbi:hypothetical protein [Henriciella marina]|uniref:hypothetical protein n=1 Tax=Henriciella marina TaxID=453851 RepID=UPI000368CADB|nr:hypothetical protein [Henriciella marina]